MSNPWYYTESVDLFGLSEDEMEAALHGASHDSFIERCAETAWRVLQEAGAIEAVNQNTRRLLEGRDYEIPPANELPNLLLGATADDPYLHTSARVLYHFVRRGEALRDGRIHDVSNHAMRLGYHVAQALHLEAWGEPVVKHRNLQEGGAQRAGKIKGDKVEAQELYPELRKQGLSYREAVRVLAKKQNVCEKTIEGYL